MTAPWWYELYDDLVADVLLDADPGGEAEATADALCAALAPAPGDRVFDQCSGTGRLTVPLAVRGLEVVAVEQAAVYVKRARARARAAGVSPALVVGDAFAYVPSPPCAAAFNWWTSFGYLTDDGGNAVMLRRAFEALVPGGRFALDFHNAAAVIRHFRPREVTRKRGLELTRESTIDLARGLLHKRWIFVTPDGQRRERPSTVRLYTPDQLARLVASVGFVDVRLFGSITGAALDLDSPRCIVLARRPGA